MLSAIYFPDILFGRGGVQAKYHVSAFSECIQQESVTMMIFTHTAHDIIGHCGQIIVIHLVVGECRGIGPVRQAVPDIDIQYLSNTCKRTSISTIEFYAFHCGSNVERHIVSRCSVGLWMYPNNRITSLPLVNVSSKEM